MAEVKKNQEPKVEAVAKKKRTVKKTPYSASVKVKPVTKMSLGVERLMHEENSGESIDEHEFSNMIVELGIEAFKSKGSGEEKVDEPEVSINVDEEESSDSESDSDEMFE